MNCQEAEKAILLDASGELPWRRQRALRTHVSACASCRAFGADVDRLHHVMAGQSVDAPESVVQAVLEQAGRQPVRAGHAFEKRRRMVMAVAAGLLLCLGGWPTWRMISQPAGPAVGSNSIALVSDILCAIRSTESWLGNGGEAAAPVTDLESLAQQILSSQGFDMDFAEETGESVSPLEERQPTTLQWRSSPGLPSGTCG